MTGTRASAPAKEGLEAFESKLAGYFGEARPWFSKIHARLFPNKPFVITAILLFGWTTPAFGITEYFVDWWFFETFAPPATLIVYLVTTCFFCVFPLVATVVIHWWEERTFLPVMRDLKQLVTSYTIQDESSGLDIDEATRYERFIRRKIKKCFKYVNHPVSIAVSLAIAALFILASIINTARPNVVFLWNYIPAFFMVFFGANVIIGILPYHVIMNDILKDVNIKIEPEHPDGIGGLAPLKDLAINTTLVVVMLAFTIPWLISLPQVLSSTLEALTYVAFGFIPLIIYAIAYVFFKPTFTLYLRIKAAKVAFLVDMHGQYLEAFTFFQGMLQGMKREIQDGKVDPGEKPVSGEIVRSQGMLVEMLKDRYDKARRMKEWPVSMSIISKLVGSLLVPVALPVLNLIIQGLF
ncbi:MAG: hypothetical protein GYA24_19180 [Candidatus Lokiarchaeota archaeon]|nr:hypothetical protein [Candidatus Lokiarchaeota archaeon]